MSPYDTMTSSDEPVECPLCMEPFELDDTNFYPCTCGYQICRFCWHRLKTDGNGLCPACRKPYCDQPAHFQPLSEDDIIRIKKERRQKEVQKKQKLTENRRHLSDTRVVQKNLVFVVGLSQRLVDVETLKKAEYFGKFGKILKVVVNPSPSYAGSQIPSASAYLTYSKADEALRAIQTVNNIQIDNRTLKASLGTTKYCSHFLKNTPCPKTDCMYLHELGEEAASFTKEEMQQGKHLEYESKLIEQILHIPKHSQNIQSFNNNINNQTESSSTLSQITNNNNSQSTTTTNTTTTTQADTSHILSSSSSSSSSTATTTTTTSTSANTNTHHTRNKWKSHANNINNNNHNNINNNSIKSATHKNGTALKATQSNHQPQLSPASTQQLKNTTSNLSNDLTTKTQEDIDRDKEITKRVNDTTDLNTQNTHLPTSLTDNFTEEIELDENRMSTASSASTPSDDDLCLNINTLISQTNEINLATHSQHTNTSIVTSQHSHIATSFQNINLYESEKEVDNFLTHSQSHAHEEEDLGFDPWRESTIALQDLMQYEKDLSSQNQNLMNYTSNLNSNNNSNQYNNHHSPNEYINNQHVTQTTTLQIPPPGFNSYATHGQLSPNHTAGNTLLQQQSIFSNSNSYSFNNGNHNLHKNNINLNGNSKTNLVHPNSTNMFNTNGYSDPLSNYLYNNGNQNTNGSMSDENYNFSLNNLLLNNTSHQNTNSHMKMNDTTNHTINNHNLLLQQKSTIDTLRSIFPNANISFGQVQPKNTTTTTTSASSSGTHINGSTTTSSSNGTSTHMHTRNGSTSSSSSTWIEDPAILELTATCTSLPNSTNNYNLYNRVNNLSNERYNSQQQQQTPFDTQTTQLPNWNDFYQQQQQQQNLMQHFLQQQQKLKQQVSHGLNPNNGYSLPSQSAQNLTSLYQQRILSNGQSSKLQLVLNGSKLSLNNSQNLDT